MNPLPVNPLPVNPPLDVDGRAAPPRRNGELVFAEPWESRVFGLAVALAESGALDWADFRRELIDRIAHAERCGEPFSYYRCWLDALERTAVAAGTVSCTDLEARGRALAAREPGHDHSMINAETVGRGLARSGRDRGGTDAEIVSPTAGPQLQPLVEPQPSQT